MIKQTKKIKIIIKTESSHPLTQEKTMESLVLELVPSWSIEDGILNKNKQLKGN